MLPVIHISSTQFTTPPLRRYVQTVGPNSALKLARMCKFHYLPGPDHLNRQCDQQSDPSDIDDVMLCVARFKEGIKAQSSLLFALTQRDVLRWFSDWNWLLLLCIVCVYFSVFWRSFVRGDHCSLSGNTAGHWNSSCHLELCYQLQDNLLLCQYLWGCTNWCAAALSIVVPIHNGCLKNKVCETRFL